LFSVGGPGGIEGDFDKAWFTMIGNTMVGTMIFVLLWPIIECIVFFALRFLPRFLDHGFSSDPYNTKATSI